MSYFLKIFKVLFSNILMILKNNNTSGKVLTRVFNLIKTTFKSNCAN